MNELSPQQLTAIACLLAGATVTKAAAEARVDRSTLYRWLREDWPFQAALNRGRRELQAGLETRLSAIAERAAETVSQAVESGDVRASLALLKGLGILAGQRAPIGSGDANVLREEAELAAQEDENHRRLRSLLPF